jgi:fido (protein-threonine AMPylation protein)
MESEINKDEAEFLSESNKIEREYSELALQDAEQAWVMAKMNTDSFNIESGLDYVLGIHRRLAKRLNPSIAGRIRECPVYIGGEVRDQSKEEIIKELVVLFKDWSEFYSSNDSLKDKEEFVKQWHIRFEKTHPFGDFNGRTGRILMNIQRLMLGLQILIIHTGIEQQNYYKWFHEI